MLNLIKFEFFRRRKMLVTTLMVFAFLEFGIWLGITLGGGWNVMAILFFVLITVGGLVFPFVDAVVNYYTDFKSRNGYMLYLTPNSGYKILGSKMIFAIAEILVMGALVIGVLSLNYMLIEQKAPEAVAMISQQFSEPMKTLLNVDKLTFWNMSPFLLMMFIQYVGEVTLALFSITIAKTLLSNKDFNWLLALVFYFATYMAVQTVSLGLIAAFGFAKDMIAMTAAQSNELPQIKKYIMVAMGTYIVFMAAAFPISGRLITKRTDL